MTLATSRPLFACGLWWACVLAGCGDEKKGAAPDSGQEPLARLEWLSGEVTLERGSQIARAEPGPLQGGDIVETAALAKARLAFSDGRTLEVGPDARFVISSKKGGVSMELSKGFLISRSGDERPDRARVPITLVTPFGKTELGAGSDVEVEVGKDSAKVSVLVGEAIVYGPDGQGQTVGAGKVVKVAVGELLVMAKDAEQPKPVMLDNVDVTIVVTSGRAELLASGSKKWLSMKKKKAALSPGDSVRVLSGVSILSLAGSGTNVSMGPGAQLRFDSSKRGGGVEETALEVPKGGLTVALAQGTRSRLLLGEVKVESDSGGQLEILRTPDGYQLTSISADLEVVRGDQRQAVRAGERALAGPKQTPVQALERPPLSLPGRMAQRVFLPRAMPVALGWAGAEKTYRVLVARDAAFKQLVSSGTVHAPYIAVTAPPRGQLHWRAFDDGASEPIGKGSASFGPEPTRESGHYSSEVPDGAEDERTTIYYQGKPPTVTFTFKPPDGKAKFAIYRTDALTAPLYEKVVSAERLVLEAGVLGEGTYAWSVSPLSEAGEVAQGGKLNRLELIYDNALLSLAITTPRNGDPALERIDTEGVAPVGSTLFINGKEAPLDEKNRFRLSTGAAGNPPVIIYRLQKSGDSDAFWVRALVRRGKARK